MHQAVPTPAAWHSGNDCFLFFPTGMKEVYWAATSCKNLRTLPINDQYTCMLAIQGNNNVSQNLKRSEVVQKYRLHLFLLLSQTSEMLVRNPLTFQVEVIVLGFLLHSCVKCLLNLPNNT